ncbi:MAG: sulfurtransferase TusA family protein [Candidatus Binatia bacterium]
MTDAPDAARAVLDLCGVRCPLAWAKAKVWLEPLARGTAVDLLVDDPRSVRDLPRAAEASGHHVVAVTGDPPRWRITLEV